LRDAYLPGEGSKRKRKKRKTDPCCEYHCYELQIRANEKTIIVHAGRLVQLYVIDQYINIETFRLEFFRKNKEAIQADLYQGIEEIALLWEI